MNRLRSNFTSESLKLSSSSTAESGPGCVMSTCTADATTEGGGGWCASRPVKEEVCAPANRDVPTMKMAVLRRWRFAFIPQGSCSHKDSDINNALKVVVGQWLKSVTYAKGN